VTALRGNELLTAVQVAEVAEVVAADEVQVDEAHLRRAGAHLHLPVEVDDAVVADVQAAEEVTIPFVEGILVSTAAEQYEAEEGE